MLECPLLAKPGVSFENGILERAESKGFCVDNYIQEGENHFQRGS